LRCTSYGLLLDIITPAGEPIRPADPEVIIRHCIYGSQY
jgi:hypothetical protein